MNQELLEHLQKAPEPFDINDEDAFDDLEDVEQFALEYAVWHQRLTELIEEVANGAA